MHLHKLQRYLQIGGAKQQSRNFSTITLPRNSNQARGLGEYAIEFLKTAPKKIDDEVYKRVQ